jgi:hypothetical protein
MTNIVGKAIIGATLLFNFFVGLGVRSPFPTVAALSVTVKNETGYDLEEVKYVLEKGDTKTLMERVQGVSDGGSCTFHLKEGGAYRVYASFVMDGKKSLRKGQRI